MSIALARIFCSSWTGTRGWGSECRPAAFTGSTGDATEARRIVRVGPRGPPRGDGDGAAARRGELRLMSPQKTVDRRAAMKG